MGPCLTFHLAGGEQGMAHMLEQFGPALKLPWTRLQAPELDDELIRRMVEGARRQAAGRSIKALERRRDDCLIRIREVLDRYWRGADEPVGKKGVTTPYEGTGRRQWRDGQPIDAPLALHRTPVLGEWVDYNGHMSESCFLLVFGDAADALFRYIGIDEDYRAGGNSFYTVETHLNHYREADEDDPLSITTRILDVDDKRLHLFQIMHSNGELLASAEQMLLHVDSKQARSAPIRPDVLARLQAVLQAHAALPRPPQIGRTIGIRPKTAWPPGVADIPRPCEPDAK